MHTETQGPGCSHEGQCCHLENVHAVLKGQVYYLCVNGDQELLNEFCLSLSVLPLEMRSPRF